MYHQPDQYRFSHDSVFLARNVFEMLTSHNKLPTTVLDLCAGCGIIGLDFLHHLLAEQQNIPIRIDFIEVQEIYSPYFQMNVETLKAKFPRSNQTVINFLNINYESFSDNMQKYDLILCNPPYFETSQGSLSPSEFKNRCRFFIDGTFKGLLKFITKSLNTNGEAYVLLRDQSAHGIDILKQTENFLGSSFVLQKMDDIRGTHLIKIIHV